MKSYLHFLAEASATVLVITTGISCSTALISHGVYVVAISVPQPKAADLAVRYRNLSFGGFCISTGGFIGSLILKQLTEEHEC